MTASVVAAQETTRFDPAHYTPHRGAFSYDLRYEPWLSITGPDGERRTGLVDVIRSMRTCVLSEDDPLMQSSLLRLLLAVVHEHLGNLSRAAHARLTELPLDEIADSVAAMRSGFDLFDVENPFMQSPNEAWQYLLSGTQRLNQKSVANLNPLIFGAGSGIVFDHRSHQSMTSIDSALAARLLVSQNAWAPGGRSDFNVDFLGRAKAAGEKDQSAKFGTCCGGIIAIAQSDTLERTMILNLLPGLKSDLGTTSWSSRGATGWLGRLTYKSRSCLLLTEPDPQDPTRGLITNYVRGNPSGTAPTVTSTVDPMWVRENVPPKKPKKTDPEAAEQASPNGADPGQPEGTDAEESVSTKEPTEYPRVRARPDKAAWRDLNSIILTEQAAVHSPHLNGSPGSPLLVQATRTAHRHDWPIKATVYGWDVTQPKTPRVILNDQFPFNADLLDPENPAAALIIDALTSAEKIADALDKAVADTYHKAFKSPPKKDTATAMRAVGKHAAHQFWFDLDHEFRMLIRTATQHPTHTDQTQASLAWKRLCARRAARLFEQYTKARGTDAYAVSAFAKSSLTIGKILKGYLT